MPTTEEVLKATRDSVRRMQGFDPNTLPREEDLGRGLNLREAVEPTKRLVDLYNQLHEDVLDSLPDDQLKPIQDRANADYKIIDDMLKFSTSAGNPADVRKNLINQITTAYDPTFKILHPWISYSVRKSTDFARLEDEGRALIQQVRDQADALRKEMEDQKTKAEEALELIRKTAAEQGVSQESYHFRVESEHHAEEAKKWRTAAIWVACALGGFAIGSFFIHKIPWLTPSNSLEAAQLIIGKGVIFATLFTMLYLCTKNFMSHKHNAVVNKHRQNALSTYQTLVKAAKDTANRDIVLTHAAHCIFNAQSTGYAREWQSDAPSAKTVIDLFAKGGGD